eukprot:CAMPEP_0117472802 /NCGR_PEP_ID=MMETSP0784-20121206/8439_1 /TAXON_ID=39447 /ORGANISM="" /LENGTH=171 /DNA_ID=CAMNT_0005266973 /DNA_START=99 /DNA_END=614 /DNA_ORIENTATION=-
MADKSKSLPFLPQPANIVGMAGDVGFDPVGFSNWIDVRWLREAELKHCRVAMLGALGFAFTSFIKLPGDMHQISAVAAHDVHVQSGALFQVLVWTSMFEIVSTKAVIEMINENSGRLPGDFGFDPLNFSKTPEARAKYEMNELKNGRLAMLAFSGMVTQAVLTGNDFPFMN